MLKERAWVSAIKKEYVYRLLDKAENNSSEEHYLKNGLETLSTLQHEDDYVEWSAIKRTNKLKSPSAGLYAWLDEYDSKLGAGIVEKRDKQIGPAAFKIRKEFCEAVRMVLAAYPDRP